MDTTLARRRFTVREYERMVEAGILGEDDRVELIDGEILTMTPIGPRHAACVDRLVALLTRSPARDRFVLRVQSPISLRDAESEPQPDLALLLPPVSKYAEHHPEGRDVLLVIEVADTSAVNDRTKKLPIYARAGIAEAWLIDLSTQTVECYHSPSPAGYTKVIPVDRGRALAPLALPELRISVERILA